MKRILFGITCALLLCSAGCSSIDEQSVDAMSTSFGVIAEEYLDYVEADPDLDEPAKERRVNHVADHRRLLEEMREGAGQ